MGIRIYSGPFGWCLLCGDGGIVLSSTQMRDPGKF